MSFFRFFPKKRNHKYEYLSQDSKMILKLVDMDPGNEL